MSAQSFEDLLVWQKAHQYVLGIYRITREFPREEMFGLVNQMRRASASITANIAEGFVRMGQKDKLHFYNISQGSLEETRNFVILSKDLGYISEEDKLNLLDSASEVSRMLNAYRQGLIKYY